MNPFVFKLLDQLDGNYKLESFNSLSAMQLDWYAFMASVGQFEIAKAMFPDSSVEARYNDLMAIVNVTQAALVESQNDAVSCGSCGGGSVR